MGFYDPRLASFERELNAHRCHRRWEQQLACDVVEVQARAADRLKRGTAPWPSDLGTLRARVDLDPMARADIFAEAANGRERVEIDIELCASRDGWIHPALGYFIGHGTSPFYAQVLRAITDGVRTREARGTCTTARLVVENIRCSNASAGVVEI